jgi:hypothetical protein
VRWRKQSATEGRWRRSAPAVLGGFYNQADLPPHRLERAAPTWPMPPGLVERPESASLRHGPQGLLANFDVATGDGVAPTIGPSRTEEDVAGPIAQTSATEPEASGLCIVDQRNLHKSAALVRRVAKAWGSAEELGAKEKRGLVPSMQTRAAFLSEVRHRLRFL